MKTFGWWLLGRDPSRKTLWKDSWTIWKECALLSCSRLSLRRTPPFLNACLTQSHHNGLDITMNWKPPHTNWYLDFLSHHPIYVKSITKPPKATYKRISTTYQEPSGRMGTLPHISGQLPTPIKRIYWYRHRQPTHSKHPLCGWYEWRDHMVTAGDSNSDWSCGLVSHSAPCSPGWTIHQIRTNSPRWCTGSLAVGKLLTIVYITTNSR